MEDRMLPAMVPTFEILPATMPTLATPPKMSLEDVIDNHLPGIQAITRLNLVWKCETWGLAPETLDRMLAAIRPVMEVVVEWVRRVIEAVTALVDTLLPVVTDLAEQMAALLPSLVEDDPPPPQRPSFHRLHREQNTHYTMIEKQQWKERTQWQTRRPMSSARIARRT